MEYVIYNKNTPVFSFEMIHNKIVKIIDIYNPKYRPMQVKYNNKKNIIEKSSFEHFLKGRRIPDTRQDKDILLENIQGKSLYELSLAYFGLSLSDQYWIKEKNDSVEWKDINFFQNNFSQDMGLFIFGKSDSSFSLKTPNNTSDGWLKKAWILDEDKRILVKGSSKPFYQEAFNEKIAYEISKILGINHIKYEIKNMDEMTYSVCENFIDENTELIPVNAIVQNAQKPNHISMYDFVIGELEKLGVNNAKNGIDEMLFLDYIIFNEDRHFNNFGFIRDVETLEVKGMAPIYDSGTSLFYNTLDTAIKSANPNVKPFYTDRKKQFELIKDRINKKIDTDKIRKIIVDVLSQSAYLEEFTPDRKKIIADRVAKSI